VFYGYSGFSVVQELNLYMLLEWTAA